MLQRLPPAVTRLKLSDKEKRDNQPRWTDNMQHSANTSTFSYLAAHPHNEDITPRTDLRSHTKAISLSPSRQQLHGRVFAFSLPDLRGREYRKNIRRNAAVGKVGFNLHTECFSGTTEAISMCVMCVNWTRACCNVVARFTKSACHHYMMRAARLRRSQTYLTSALGKKKESKLRVPKNNLT